MVTITNELARHIIRELLTDGGNHRRAVFEQTNRQFLQYALDFLRRAQRAKIHWEEQPQSSDWYATFAAQADSTGEVSIIGGVPTKTVFNIYGHTTRTVVLDAAQANVAYLGATLEELTALQSPPIDVAITLDDGFRFDRTESLLIVNSLAVKRQQISGGNWSSAGNAVEHPLMETLCHLYSLDEQNFRRGSKKDGRHQVDFMLQRSGVEYRCEVKLNGRGNPESVTGAIARDPRIVLADHISEQNREKLDSSSIRWVDFSDDSGFRRFSDALDAFHIPHSDPANLDRLDEILDTVLPLP